MKTYRQCACFAVLFIAFSACQSSPFGIMDNEFSDTINDLNERKTISNPPTDSLTVLLKSLAPTPETFVVHEGKNVVTTTKGTRLNLDNAIFVDPKGRVIKDDIVVTIQELHTPSDMLLADKPTNTRKTNGYLASFGEFKITANQHGQPLDLQSGSRIVVETEVDNSTKKQFLKMPIWDADTTDVVQQLKGLNHLAEPTRVTQFFRQKRGAVWIETPQSAETNAFNRLQFDLMSLNKWKNCDIFQADTTQKTTVMCHFAENITPSVLGGETATQTAAVYFKPLNVNALIKFYQPILNAPLSKSGFYSEENGLPIGTKGTLIAVSFKDGKLYADKQNVTIHAPQTPDKAAFFTMNPVEISQAAFSNSLMNL